MDNVFTLEQYIYIISQAKSGSLILWDDMKPSVLHKPNISIHNIKATTYYFWRLAKHQTTLYDKLYLLCKDIVDFQRIDQVDTQLLPNFIIGLKHIQKTYNIDYIENFIPILVNMHINSILPNEELSLSFDSD